MNVCQLCSRLKNIEDDWIMRLGTFYYPGGLNKRDEIKKKWGQDIKIYYFVSMVVWLSLCFAKACFLVNNYVYNPALIL